MLEDVLEKAAAVGAISVIIFWSFLWLDRRRRKRKAEKKAAREQASQRAFSKAPREAFSKAPREDDEEGARKFARKTVPDIE